ncbi:MAG: sulfurtransferase [Actinomycetota bacterium]|jgi:thiosulfate/3-mercaptopyruvate sulfurtransferase|nr:sulfurtransferase [Actinomycetota bacterium]
MDSLVSTAWLAEHLDDPDVRILECTVDLKPGPGGFVAHPIRDQWADGHIPNSAYADLTNDLSEPNSDLRFTMPTPELFAASMEALGVGQGTRVVLYDRRMTMWATRVFWMLRAFGFDDCAVLDGGWKSWTSEGRVVSTEPAPTRPTASFVAAPKGEMIASVDDMLAAVGDETTCIVNSLSPQNHDGSDKSYGRPGHIPGASNVFAVSLVDPDTQRYRPTDELASMFEHLPAEGPVITYCGGGIAATSDAFVLTELLGRDEVAVYDGSLSEWLQDPAHPMEV